MLTEYEAQYITHRQDSFGDNGRERSQESGEEFLETGKQVSERGKAVVDEAMEFADRGGRRRTDPKMPPTANSGRNIGLLFELRSMGMAIVMRFCLRALCAGAGLFPVLLRGALLHEL